MLWVCCVWLLLYWKNKQASVPTFRSIFSDHGAVRLEHCAHILESFHHKWVLSFVKGFLCTYWDNHMAFIFQFVDVVYYIDLRILKNPCIPRINQIDHGVWAFWCVVEFCLVKFCWGFLHLCSSVILAGSFLYLYCLCLVLVSGWWWPHRMSLEVFFPLQFFESFRRIGVSSSLNVWQNSPVKPSGPGLCFLGDFFYHSFNFSDCNWIVHNFYFSWFSLGRLNFSKNLPFLPGYLFYCHIIVHHKLF